MNELALFAGAGGGILGGKLLGWRTVCAVERDRYARSVLLARQNDRMLEPFPIWDDVRTFDGRPWRGIVDVVSGGFPCQDISTAGKGAGITGERSGLWKEFARIIGEVGPRYVFVENSPALTSRGLGTVLGDLATLGYDAEWGVLGAQHAIAYSGDRCADHPRDRIWIAGAIPNANSMRELQQKRSQQNERRWFGYVCEEVANTVGERQPGPWKSWFSSDPSESREGETNHAFHERVGQIWGAQSPVGRVANGVASRMDRLRCIGNGQVPSVAALAFTILRERLTQ